MARFILVYLLFFFAMLGVLFIMLIASGKGLC